MPKNKKIKSKETVGKIADFKTLRSKIREMYEGDQGVIVSARKDSSLQTSSQLNSLTIDAFRNQYYALNDLSRQRAWSLEAYQTNAIYATLIDYLSNMFTWDYIYWPRLIKGNKDEDYDEIYKLIGEVVDGICVETTYPTILTNLFVEGAVYLYAIKNTSSHTISMISLPVKYCRPRAITQFGTYIYDFNFAYFDSLGLKEDELELVWSMYPPDFQSQYNEYKKDKKNMQWQTMNPKFAGAILSNNIGFPSKLIALEGILQYNQYKDNELARNEQLLDKIIAHKMPTWEDKLVVDLDEMKELHQSISQGLSKNKRVKFITTFGDLETLSIGEDQSKENKTLINAYNAILDTAGENNSLFTGSSVESLKYALKRDESIVWKYIEQITALLNLAINNSFNFKSYQCDFAILPVTLYNRSEMLDIYREGATLGTTKIEYIVVTGTKQINIKSKIAAEDYLGLDKLKPLSTSYTQKDNSKSGKNNKEENKDENELTDENNTNVDKEKEKEEKQNKEQEVEADENNTN